jgi:hypothetical protein
MLKVETAGLISVNVLMKGSFALVKVWTRSLVHRRTHRKPAVNIRTAQKMDALCEYFHSFFWSTIVPELTGFSLGLGWLRIDKNS